MRQKCPKAASNQHFFYLTRTRLYFSRKNSRLQRIGISRAIVSEVRVGDSAGSIDACSIRDRPARGATDRARRFVRDFAARGHRHCIIDVARASSTKPESAAGLGGSIGDGGERAREVIL